MTGGEEGQPTKAGGGKEGLDKARSIDASWKWSLVTGTLRNAADEKDVH